MLFLAVLIEIGLAAEHADFLGAGPQQADRAAGLARSHDVLCRGGDDAASRRVVDRTRREIPAIEMAGDDDRARGRVAARNLGADLAGCLVADRLRGEQPFHLERTGRALALAAELI